MPDRPFPVPDATVGIASGERGTQFVVTETSSRTNEVASEESSVPVNFSVTDLPMNELTLIVLSW